MPETNDRSLLRIGPSRFRLGVILTIIFVLGLPILAITTNSFFGMGGIHQWLPRSWRFSPFWSCIPFVDTGLRIIGLSGLWILSQSCQSTTHSRTRLIRMVVIGCASFALLMHLTQRFQIGERAWWTWMVLNRQSWRDIAMLIAALAVAVMLRDSAKHVSRDRLAAHINWLALCLLLAFGANIDGAELLRGPWAPKSWDWSFMDTWFSVFQGIVLIIAALVLMEFNQLGAYIKQKRCPRCGFDIKGDWIGGCPECGWRREAGLPS